MFDWKENHIMLKTRIWEILELSKENDKQSKYFDYFISVLILLNVVAIILETEKTLVIDYKTYFKNFPWWKNLSFGFHSDFHDFPCKIKGFP